MVDWVKAYLTAAGYPNTPKNRQFLTSWQRYEGGHTNNNARYNYLNTTQDMGGSPSINSVGVRSYASLQQGAQAFAQTLKNGKYVGLDAALRAGDPYTKDSIPGLSTWLSGKVDPHGIAYASKVLGTHVAADREPQVHSSLTTPVTGGAGPDFKSIFSDIASGDQTPTEALSSVAQTARNSSRAALAPPPVSGLVAPPGAQGGDISKWVKLAEGADRQGVPTKQGVIDFVGQLGESYGSPLTIGTGSNHKKVTQDGFVSDHWDGNAADVPASGQNLLRLGYLALVQAGMSPADAKKAAAKGGGLFNVGGYQIIFGDYPGHSNHLHVGIRG